MFSRINCNTYTKPIRCLLSRTSEGISSSSQSDDFGSSGSCKGAGLGDAIELWITRSLADSYLYLRVKCIQPVLKTKIGDDSLEEQMALELTGPLSPQYFYNCRSQPEF